ncbi:MAG: hypothetical protein ACXVAM_17170 [Vulcanimicrobiaceae bacterium]
MQSVDPLRMGSAMVERRMIEEPRWHAALAVLAAIALYLRLPPKITLGPFWLLPVLVLLPLAALMIFKPRYHQETRLQRAAAIWVTAALNVFNIATVVLMLVALAGTPHHPPKDIKGQQILAAAVQIWLTNILVYSLWYFELDGGGPDVRAHAAFEQVHRRADFLFPQMALGPDIQKGYGFRPQFLDYVFLAFNTATAFSPTDTYPLTPMGKALMMGESLTSLVTIAVIASRAINILS